MKGTCGIDESGRPRRCLGFLTSLGDIYGI
jgi:hypothetical protein